MDTRSPMTRQAGPSGLPGLPVSHVGHRNGLARRSKLRRRFMLVSVAMLASLLAVLGVGFAQDAGTSTVSVALPAGVSAFAVSSSAGTAPQGVVSPADDVVLKWGSASTGGSSNWSAVKVPKWQVGAGASCAFSAPGDANNAPGDLIFLDASDTTTTKLMISVFVTNLDVLAAYYSSWSFEMHVYQAPSLTGPWTSSVASQRIQSDRGSATFVVDITGGNHYLNLTLDEGACYAVAVPSDPADLQPAFFVQASEL
ncbi:MAG: hypothetical protein WEA29_08250 [Acidimicrobiia bacterium]